MFGHRKRGQSSAGATEPAVHSSFTYTAPRRRAKRTFGAWYIPPQKWRVMENGVPSDRPAHHRVPRAGATKVSKNRPATTGGAGFKAAPSAAAAAGALSKAKDSTSAPPDEAKVMNDKARAFRKQIPTLRISQLLRSYIDGNHHRVPHFLQNVSASSDASYHMRGSKRGQFGATT